ncbi:dimethyl sulfoxide reductase anchor subunit [soil metagenome]
MVFSLISHDPERAEVNLIDRLLTEQQRLTAVERFSQRHAGENTPSQARYYRDLIPIRKPDRCEQYAFEVDLDACSSCKACVTACHSLNGLAEDESWRDVGVLFGGTVLEPVQRTVTAACHHCADPACANGCPVLAYEKDAETGIVRHLDDQCIGCKYCQLKCPYDVPKYNHDRGIVRKCDMCYSRLTADEAPACVQACPNGAIAIRIVRTAAAARNALDVGVLVPGAHRSSYTQPTTIYRSSVMLDDTVEAADLRRIDPSDGHAPLVAMLVLTQASAGVALLHFVSVVTERGGTGWVTVAYPALGVVLCGIGMAASVIHLGQPHKAWRAFLGWRKSWLSREIIALNAFIGAASAAVVAAWIIPESVVTLAAAAGAAGTAALVLLASAMVYIDTRREFWSPWLTGTRFVGTAFVLAPALLAALEPSPALAVASALALVAKLVAELLPLRAARQARWSGQRKSALVQLGPLRSLLALRLGLAAAGVVVVLAGCVLASGALAAGGAILLLAGEFAERSLFFRAVDTPKMPGIFKA